MIEARFRVVRQNEITGREFRQKSPDLPRTDVYLLLGVVGVSRRNASNDVGAILREGIVSRFPLTNRHDAACEKFACKNASAPGINFPHWFHRLPLFTPPAASQLAPAPRR
jgi:hypothetical protein